MNPTQYALELLKRIQQAAERALALLNELDQAIGAGDHRKIGASLSDLRRELKAIQSLIREKR